MNHQINYLASLSFVDRRLDELQEDYGDLPVIVRGKENKVKSLKALVDETTSILQEIKQFCSTSKITLIELKNKEEKLSKQQFLVRNNKEFDAITKEIAHIREEHSRLTDQLRTEGVKEENLMGILAGQQKDLAEADKELAEITVEMEFVASDQNAELKDLLDKRNGIVEYLSKASLLQYDRIRHFHKDAVVKIIRNSCSGCFSSIPPQKIVEIRNDLDNLYCCESCGRILYPEDMTVKERELILV
jgi:uncharacterized protein